MIRKAILLAAGRGTRLGDLTIDRPKPMVPIRGIPIAEIILRGLAHAGIQEILFVVGYRSDAIVSHFGNGSSLGVSVQYIHQERLDGTGAALLLGREFAGDQPFFGGYADILVQPGNYTDLIADFAAEPCAALVGANWLEDVSAGAAIYTENRRVTRIVEKPRMTPDVSHWNQAGLSAYGPEIWPALERVPLSPRGEYELTTAIEYLVADGDAVRMFEVKGPWSDVGTPEKLAEGESWWQGL